MRFFGRLARQICCLTRVHARVAEFHEIDVQLFPFEVQNVAVFPPRYIRRRHSAHNARDRDVVTQHGSDVAANAHPEMPTTKYIGRVSAGRDSGWVRFCAGGKDDTTESTSQRRQHTAYATLCLSMNIANDNRAIYKCDFGCDFAYVLVAKLCNCHTVEPILSGHPRGNDM